MTIRAAALAGSVCLHGALLALVLRLPAGSPPSGDGDSTDLPAFCADDATALPQASTTSLPNPASPPGAASLMAPPPIIVAQQPTRSPTTDIPEIPPATVGQISQTTPHRSPGAGKRSGTGRGSGGNYIPPSYLKNPAPSYPLAARLSRHEGLVILSVPISEEGRPGDISIEKSSGDAALDRAAITTVKTWLFHPARMKGIPIAVQVSVPVMFRLR